MKKIKRNLAIILVFVFLLAQMPLQALGAVSAGDIQHDIAVTEGIVSANSGDCDCIGECPSFRWDKFNAAGYSTGSWTDIDNNLIRGVPNPNLYTGGNIRIWAQAYTYGPIPVGPNPTGYGYAFRGVTSTPQAPFIQEIVSATIVDNGGCAIELGWLGQSAHNQISARFGMPVSSTSPVGYRVDNNIPGFPWTEMEIVVNTLCGPQTVTLVNHFNPCDCEFTPCCPLCQWQVHDPCVHCGECQNCSQCLVFGLNVFNNGTIQSSSIENRVRMWTQINGVNGRVPYELLTITATFPNGDCAMEFVNVNRIWNDQDNFNSIDVFFGYNNVEWSVIYFTATLFACGEPVEVRLVNPHVNYLAEGYIFICFDGMESVSIQYWSESVWHTLPGIFNNNHTFYAPNATSVRVLRPEIPNQGTWYQRDGLVAPGPNRVYVPITQLYVRGVPIDDTFTLAVVGNNWVYNNVPALMAGNDFTVFGDGRAYEVRLNGTGFFTLSRTSSEGYDNGYEYLYVDLSAYFAYITVPQGVSNVRMQSNGWIINPAQEGDGIWLIVDRSDYRDAIVTFDYCCLVQHRVDFLLDGHNPLYILCNCCPSNPGNPCIPCLDCGNECVVCNDCPDFRFDIFNNGSGIGAAPSRPNANIGSIIRMWTGFGPVAPGPNTPLSLSLADSITAIDQDGNNAMDFITVNEPWNNQGYFNFIDVNKNASWQTILLTITVCGEKWEFLLINSRFFSLNIFNNGPEGCPSTANESLANAGLIRMWTQLGGVNADVPITNINAVLPNGSDAMEFIRVNSVDGGLVRSIDGVKDAEWEFIYLYITVFDQTVRVVLHNDDLLPTTPTVTINFEAGEGTGTMAGETVVVGTTFTLPANEFTAPNGYKFYGWFVEGYADPLGSLIPGDDIVVGIYPWPGTVTVTAMWVPIIPPTVKAGDVLFREQRAPSQWFYLVGADERDPILNPGTHGHYGTTAVIDFVYETSTFYLDVSHLATQVAIDFAGLLTNRTTFTGTAWWVDAPGNVVDLETVALIYTTIDDGWETGHMPAYLVVGTPAPGETRILAMVVDGVAFYVVINRAAPAPTVTINFEAGGGTGTMADVFVIVGEDFTLPTNGFTAPAGYRFYGWFVTGYAAPGGAMTPGGVITVSIWPDTTVTVTAQWVPILLGDVNGDGFVNWADFHLLVYIVNGGDIEFVFENADMNGDGVLDNDDVALLRILLESMQ